MDIKTSNNDNILSEILPSFGGTASFSSTSETINFGDNHKQSMISHINGLSMSLSLNFEDITQNQAHDLIAFLQSRYYYEPQVYSNEGKFTNKRIEPFDYLPFYPYKSNKFHCHGFTHNKNYYNVHSVSANLVSHSASILDNVEMGTDYNATIGSKIIVEDNINPSNTEVLLGFFEIKDNTVVAKTNQHLFEPNGYRNAILTRDMNADADANFNTFGIAPLGFGAGDVICQHTPFRHSIFLDSPNDCDYRPYAPVSNGEELSARMFDFRPNSTIRLSHSPKYKKSSISDVQSKFNKYGFNPNLNNMSLRFENRSDIEAKRILYFLESHLGYKKFGFHGLDYYNRTSNDDTHTSPHRKSLSFFICPEWSHTFVYKNNHTIEASFIECLDY
jgi:phage-related protein